MRPLLILLLSLMLPFGAAFAETARPRPAAWASPVAASELGNCYRLDDKLFRSAQPDAEGFAEARKLGIRTILNLRSGRSDLELAAGQRLVMRRVPTEAGSLDAAQLLQALRIIHDSEGPVLVHCWHGSDRTGAVCALYRMVVQGWEREAAIDEMINGGYGFHDVYDNIPALLRSLDLDALRGQFASR